MENLYVTSFFSEEDKLFNREMVMRSLDKRDDVTVPERRGGKMPMGDLFARRLYQGRKYDFTSEILGEYRKKWGIE